MDGLSLKAILMYMKPVKGFRLLMLLHMSNSTGFGVTTHLNKDLQKVF